MINRSIYEMLQEFERILRGTVPVEHWDDSGLWRWTVIDTINAAMFGSIKRNEIHGMLSWHPAVNEILAAYDQATNGHW